MTRIIDKGAPRGRTQPEPLPVPQEAPMPVLRLRRLGVSDSLVASVAAMWEQMDAEQAAAVSETMTAMSDRELLVALVGEPEDGQDPNEWAATHQHPTDAARVLLMPS